MLAAIFAGALTVNGATYYVATTGSDSNPGSSTQPFRTIQRGVDASAAGDTIIVRDGTYTASCPSAGSGYVVTLTRSGTSGAWITLKAENKRGAAIDGGASCHSSIRTDSGSYWVIDGFRLTNGYYGGITSNPGSEPGADYITVKNCEFAYIGQRYATVNAIVGAGANATAQNWTFDGNAFHDIGRTGPTDMMVYDHGMYIRSQNTKIVNNVFYAPIAGWAIQTANGFSGTIANNTFHGDLTPSKDGHIMLWDSNPSLVIRNNIFSQPGGYAITSYALSTSSCTIDNNIVYGTSSVGTPGGCTASNNRVNTDPMLVNTASKPYDLHVKAGSPAIDTAVSVSGVTTDQDGIARPQGSGPDVGSYEYASQAPNYPPVISAVGATGIGTSSATITWTTNEPSDSQVQYGVGSASGSTPANPSMVTSHSVALTGLSASTTYTYRVVSKDSAGASSQSSLYTFTTAAATTQFSFSLSPSPATLSLVKGESGSSAVTAALVSGSAQAVTFSAANVPGGVTVSFSPSSCTVTCATTVSVASTTGATSGTYAIQVNGSGGGATSAATITLTVSDPTPVTGGGVDLAANWPMDEGSGMLVTDATVYHNNGVFNGSSTWYKRGSVTAVQFKGTGDYIRVPESDSLQMTTAMTVAFWVAPTDVPGVDERIMSKAYTWGIKLNGTNRTPQFSAAGRWATMNTSLPAQSWTHVAFTFSGGVVKGYVNGRPVAMAENTFTSGVSLPVNAYGLILGADTDGASPMKGLLDEVRLHGRALSDVELYNLYYGQLKQRASNGK